MPEAQYPLRAAVQRTGLKPDRIRSWEKRYGAISPGRSESNQRLFSEADIARLRVLKEGVGSGLAISRIAGLSNDEILQLTGPRVLIHERSAASGDDFEPLEGSFLAIEALDSETLRRILERQMMELGRIDFLDRFLTPLMVEVGARYDRGTLRIAHEHLASATIRSVLDSLRPAYPPDLGSPGIIVGTPRGQHHELAALLAAASARIEGWKVTYLGPNLPAEEYAAAVGATDSRAVALSITVAGDSALEDELRRLRATMPATEILVGGRAAETYQSVLESFGAELVLTLADFRGRLTRLRAAPSPRS